VADDRNRALAREGAAHSLTWSREAVESGDGSLVSRVRALAPDGIQAVIDLVDRDPEAFGALVNGVLANGGRAVSTPNATSTAVGGHVEAINVFTPRSAEMLQRPLARVEDCTLRAPVARVLDLESIDEAFAALTAGPSGKIIIRAS
jgi:NADPH:quinone reductase-like Zn-dependent oxidoreductase